MNNDQILLEGTESLTYIRWQWFRSHL